MAVEHGIERENDLPWDDKKVAIFNALKALKARDYKSARSSGEILVKARVSQKQVRHYCYHARAAKLVDVFQDRFKGNAYGYALTKKGAKIDPVAELEAQRAGRRV